jgi:ribosomal protein S27E
VQNSHTVKWKKETDRLMTFEKQICEQCGKLVVCYHHQAVVWLCDTCYAWVIEHSIHKDKVREIMIQCGLEDLE